MSKISRRDFLKSAGVAALAVAAAGALSGCSKNDIPVIPGTTKKVIVCYHEVYETILTYEEVTVAADAEYVVKADLEKIPAGYVLKQGEEKWLICDGYVWVDLEKVEEDGKDEETKPETETVEILYHKDGDVNTICHFEYMEVSVGATTISSDDLKEIPEGTVLADSSKGELRINDGFVWVDVVSAN